MLDIFDTKKICPPLLVIQLLAQHANAKLRMIKDFILKNVTEEDKRIKEAQDEILQYQDAASNAKKQIEEHKLKYVISLYKQLIMQGQGVPQLYMLPL